MKKKTSEVCWLLQKKKFVWFQFSRLLLRQSAEWLMLQALIFFKVFSILITKASFNLINFMATLITFPFLAHWQNHKSLLKER